MEYEQWFGPLRLDMDAYGMQLALAAASRSEDPHNAVGAVVFRLDKTVAAVGYNGAPPGVELDWNDREARRQFVVHAEANALRYVRPHEADVLVTTMMPCLECVKLIASYGIKRVIYGADLDGAVYPVAEIMDFAARCDIYMTKLVRP